MTVRTKFYEGDFSREFIRVMNGIQDVLEKHNKCIYIDREGCLCLDDSLGWGEYLNCRFNEGDDEGDNA